MPAASSTLDGRLDPTSRAELPVLYSFRRCPYAMRARMALLRCGVTVRVRELILRAKPPEMLALSPKGTVPVLVCSNGEIIDESLDVMDWAIAQNPTMLSAPSAEQMKCIERNDGPFKRALDRYKYPDRYENVDPLQHRAIGAEILWALDQQLTESLYLSGGESGYTDLAIFPFVRQFRIADMAWFDAQEWAHLSRWLDENLQSPLFAAAMKKYPLWVDTKQESLLGPDEDA
ncbi:MAG: glutathione S-transferase [Pseudomonadota bacterium]